MEKRDSGISSGLLCLTALGLVFLQNGRSCIPKISELSGPISRITNVPVWVGVWILLVLIGYRVGCGFFTSRYILYGDDELKIRKFFRFYLGRLVRMAPLYYVYCFLFEIFSGNFYFLQNRKQLIEVLTFLYTGNEGVDGICHLWLVSLLMQTYLIMPFIYVLIFELKKKKVPLIATYGIVTVAGFCVRAVFMSRGCDWYANNYTIFLANVDLVFVGMLVAEIRSTFSVHLKKPTLYKIGMALLLVVLTVYIGYLSVGMTEAQFRTYTCLVPTAYAVICGLLLLLSGSGRTVTAGSLLYRLINWLCGHTYSFYIFHVAVLLYLKEWMTQNEWFVRASAEKQCVSFFLIGALCTLVIAVLFNWIGKRIDEAYTRLERKVFH